MLDEAAPSAQWARFSSDEDNSVNTIRRRTLSDVLRLLGLMTLLGSTAEAQAVVSGQVFDPDGLAVASAKLTLINRNSGGLRQAISSDDGSYSFPGLSDGIYLLEGEASERSLAGSRQIVVSGSTTLNLMLGLATTTVQVVVTATGTPLSQQEVAKVIDVVDAKQVNERDEYAVAEVLRAVPGVQIQTQVGGVTSIKTRGLRNQDTAVLIDGLRFRDAAATQGDATGFLSDMNVVDLGRAEFLRGSGSSLYGSNAIAGAVSLNSNQGGGPAHGALRAEGGGLGLFRGTANIAGGAAGDRFTYSGGFSQLNVTRGVRGKTPNRNTSGQVFSTINLAPTVSLSGRLWGSNAFQRLVVSPQFPASVVANFPESGVVRAVALPDSQISLLERGEPFNAGNATFVPAIADPDASRESSFLTGALIFRQELSPNTAWRMSYQGVDTNRASLNGPLGLDFQPSGNEKSDFDGRTDLVQIRLDTRAGNANLITMGYEMERENLRSIAARARTDPEVSVTSDQVSHSYYGQDQMRLLGDRLQVALGGRVQHFQLQQPEFAGDPGPYGGVQIKSPDTAYTGDISVAYVLPESDTKFRGHIGNSYRAPSLYERFGSGYFSGSFSYYGDPRLMPEKSTAFDGGIDQWLFDSKMRFSATYFYTDLSETIIFDFANFPAATDPFGRFGGYRNSKGGGIARGVELSIQFSPSSSTSVQMSYTYTNSDQRTPTIGLDFFQALRIADHTFSLTATQWVTRRFNLTVDFYGLSDSFESPFGAGGRRMRFGGPKKTDLVANYNIPLTDTRSVDVYGKVENLFDVSYTDNGFYAPGAWAIGGLKYTF